MTTIVKQLIIKRFDLPEEIIDIIKEYAFYNIIDKTKKYKNKLVKLIENSMWTPVKFVPLTVTGWLFWAEDDGDNSVQFQADFCIHCGNYLFSAGTINKQSMICKCYVDW